MKKKFLLIILTLSFCCVLLFTFDCEGLFSADNRTISAGTAKVNITPKVPLPMSGYSGRKEPFQGVHDDLFMRAIAFSDGVTKAAIVSADLIGIPLPLWEECTKRLEKDVNIPPDNILLCATHTHGGPTPADGYSSLPPETIAYTNDIKEKLIAVVKEAFKNLKPASIGSGKGECKMNMNRRARNAKGGITLGNNPYGPCDREVGVIRIDDESGRPFCIFITWHCHATVMGPGNLQITADWPGAAVRFVEKEFGNNVTAVVTAGSSGNIDPIYRVLPSFKSSVGEVETVGIVLGEEVVRIAKDIKTAPFGSISGIQRVINFPAKSKEESLQPERYQPGETIYVRLSALKIGNIVFAGTSGGLFNEIAGKVKELSPYKYTFVMDKCNGGYNGYIVTNDSYKEGGYEVESSRIKSDAGAEKAVIKNLIDMIYGL